MEKLLRCRKREELNYFLVLQKEDGQLVDYVHGYPINREELAETYDITGFHPEQVVGE